MNSIKYKAKINLIAFTMVIFIFTIVAHISVMAVTKEEHDSAIKGIDISSFNGDTDLKKVKSNGYDYVMIRTGSGKNTVDPNFAVNYGKAGDAGLKRGVYHYSYAKTVEDAKAEAKACLAIIENRNLECPVTFDIEEDAAFSTGKENVSAMVEAFCETIKEAGYEPMVYSSQNKLTQYFDENVLSKYKLWIASYDIDYPDYPYPYYMWQYKIGSVEGANTLSGECDVNYIYEEFVPADKVEIDQTELALELGEDRQ